MTFAVTRYFILRGLFQRLTQKLKFYIYHESGSFPMGNKTEVSKTKYKKKFKNFFDVRTSLRLPIENTRSSCLNLIIAKLSLIDLTLVFYSTFGLADQDVK